VFYECRDSIIILCTVDQYIHACMYTINCFSISRIHFVSSSRDQQFTLASRVQVLEAWAPDEAELSSNPFGLCREVMSMPPHAADANLIGTISR